MLYSCPVFESRSNEIVPIVTANHHPFYGNWKVEYTGESPLKGGASNGEIFYINATDGSFTYQNSYQEEMGMSGKTYFSILESKNGVYIYEYNSYDGSYTNFDDGFVRIKKIQDTLYIERADTAKAFPLEPSGIPYARKVPVKL